jgi:hypothetical protein
MKKKAEIERKKNKNSKQDPFKFKHSQQEQFKAKKAPRMYQVKAKNQKDSKNTHHYSFDSEYEEQE